MDIINYKWVIHDNRYDRDIAELQHAGNRKFSYGLNRFGDFSFTLPLTDINATRSIIKPLRRGIKIFRNNHLIFRGDIYTIKTSIGVDKEPQVEVAGNGLLRRLEGRECSANTYTDKYPRHILRKELDLINARSHTRIEGLKKFFQVTTKRTVKPEQKPYTDFLQEVADADGAYYYVDTNGRLKYWTSQFTYTRSDYAFVYGTNITEFEWDEDASEMATYMTTTGQDGSPVVISRNPSCIREWGLFERREAFTDQVNTNYLKAQAQRQVIQHRNPVSNFSFVLWPDKLPGFRAFKIGTKVRLRVNRGYCKVNRLVLVVGFEIDIDDTGLEKVTCLTGRPVNLWRQQNKLIARLTKLERQ